MVDWVLIVKCFHRFGGMRNFIWMFLLQISKMWVIWTTASFLTTSLLKYCMYIFIHLCNDGTRKARPQSMELMHSNTAKKLSLHLITIKDKKNFLLAARHEWRKPLRTAIRRLEGKSVIIGMSLKYFTGLGILHWSESLSTLKCRHLQLLCKASIRQLWCYSLQETIKVSKILFTAENNCSLAIKLHYGRCNC